MVRNEDNAEWRNKIITITPKGKDLYQKVKPVLDEVFHLLNKEVTSEEISLLNIVVVKMNIALE